MIYIEGYAESLLLSQNLAITKKLHFDPNDMKLGQNDWLMGTLRSLINARSGINALVGRFHKNNKRTVWNN